MEVEAGIPGASSYQYGRLLPGGDHERLNNFATSGTGTVYAIVQETLNDDERGVQLSRSMLEMHPETKWTL